MRTVWLPSKFSPVEGYFSYMPKEDKEMYAMKAVAHVESTRNLTPISVSVVGSVLRGNDRMDSDVDVLVVVKDKIRSKVFSFIDDNGVEIDGKIESLDNFFAKLPTSVPYMEFAFSPFRLTASGYYALFNSLALSNINSYVFEVHADDFIEHALERAAKNNTPLKERKARDINIAVDYLLANKTATMPRELFN